jgi:hypothetical protein
MTTTIEPTNQERCNEPFLSSLPLEVLEGIHGGRHDNCRDADGHVPEHYGRYGEDWLGYTHTV